MAKGNIKEQVASIARSVLKHYRFCSLGELNAILSQYNLAVEEVKTEFRGKKYDGLVYVPTDGWRMDESPAEKQPYGRCV